MKINSSNPSETKKIGYSLGKSFFKKTFFLTKKRAVILALEGNLGGGKTTFLQGFAKGLGVKSKILSPTFVLMKKFKIPENKKFKNFYHFDCYRLKNKKDLLELGFEKIIDNPQNIVAIEWADKIKKTLPKNKIIIKFNFLNKKNRKIWIKNV